MEGSTVGIWWWGSGRLCDAPEIDLLGLLQSATPILIAEVIYAL